MKIRVFFWLAMPVLLGATSFVATRQFRREEVPAPTLDPIIEYPAKVDLGERENGEQAVGRFSIANRGGSELVIDQFRTNCSCTGMEREQEGRFIRLDSVRLKPGEQTNLAIRVSVRGVPVGASMHNFIEFQTNDPNQPTGRMEVVVRRVWGGISITPPEVVFAPVPVGKVVRKVLDVRDTATTPRAIGRVTSTDPNRIAARLLPIEDLPQEPQANPGGTLIGQVEVVIDTRKAGAISGKVQVELAGETRPPDEVRIAGTVVAPVEMRPAALVLPRLTANGPLYSAQCLCRSTLGKTLTLTADSVPAGLTVQISSPEGATSTVVQITWDPERGTAPEGNQRQLIRFRAKAGEDELTLELPILLRKMLTR